MLSKRWRFLQMTEAVLACWWMQVGGTRTQKLVVGHRSGTAELDFLQLD